MTATLRDQLHRGEAGEAEITNQPRRRASARSEEKNRRRRIETSARTRRRWGRLAIGAVVAAAFLFPIWIALVTSVDRASQVFVFPPHLLPSFDFGPYVRVWQMARWLMYFRNTFVISSITVVLALTTSILAAWALSIGGLRRSEAIFRTFLVALIVPGESLLVPNYLILYKFHLFNTLWAQILPFGASVYGVFLLREFFLTLPKSYWEAAALDGAGPLRYLWSVAIPLARPILFTVGLYIFIGSWNSFQWPLIVTFSHHVQPIEVAVERLQQTHSVDWRRLSAAGVIATAPLVALFLLVQKHIVKGITRNEGLSG